MLTLIDSRKTACAAPFAPASRFIAFVLSLSCFLLTACTHDGGPPGPERTETRNIELDKSEEVKVDLQIAAGELRVEGGADKLMEARFTYNRLRLRPEVSYMASGSQGHLKVEEPNHVATVGPRYAWDLRFNNHKPLDLNIECGAGESRLYLGDLTLRHVSVEMGVGQLKMDLRGTPQNDYQVKVEGGVGEATIYLPDNVGIDAHVEGGIGGIHAPGLEKRDGRYVNGAFGHAKNTVRLDVEGGIGSINLIAN